MHDDSTQIRKLDISKYELAVRQDRHWHIYIYIYQTNAAICLSLVYINVLDIYIFINYATKDDAWNICHLLVLS